jgi:hypothetical protein
LTNWQLLLQDPKHPLQVTNSFSFLLRLLRRKGGREEEREREKIKILIFIFYILQMHLAHHKKVDSICFPKLTLTTTPRLTTEQLTWYPLSISFSHFLPPSPSLLS